VGAIARGVTGTPTFFLNGKPYGGSYETFALIEAIAAV
jgi:protein-disulfide isomerase